MGSIVLIEYAILFLTIGCFLVAAVAEIRYYKRGLAFFLRMAEAAAGAVSFWAMTRVGQSVELSWTMVWASLLLGGSALVSRFASRAALFFMLVGCATLAFLWYFKGAYHH